MRVLYAKTTDDRCKKFQIYTKITEESGVRSVIKGNVYPEGKEHIERIYKNYLSLKSLHFALFHVIPCELENGEVVFPYAEGKQLSDDFFEAVQNSDRETFIGLLKRYISLIDVCEENKIPFYDTEEFRNIFGTVSGLEGLAAYRVSNIDCDVDNIALLNGEMTIFDYEWVYDFPIPADFVLYRNLLYLYHFDIIKNKAPVPFEEACDLAGISLPAVILNQMNSNFSHMVNFEPQQKEDALSIKNRYLKDTSFHTALPNKNHNGRDQKQFVVYVKEAQDSGFSEEKTIRYAIEPSSVDLTADLTPFPGVESVRIDPMECPCVLTEVQIALDGSPLDQEKLQPVNGKRFENGKTIFTDNDPQIFLDADLKGIRALHFSCVVEQYDDPFIRMEYGLLEEMERLEEEIAKLRMEKNGLAAEAQSLQEAFDAVSAVKEEQDGTLYDIYNSRAWKLITRYRKMKDKLRRK